MKICRSACAWPNTASPETRDKSSPALVKSDYYLFVDQDARSMQHLHRLQAGEGVRQARSGLLDDKLASERNWQHQLTVPINTHGSLLGQIDAFSSAREFSERDVNMLGAFAHGVALNLARIDMAGQADALLSADREMASAQSLEDLYGIVLRWAIKLTHADAGCLYTLDESGQLLTAQASTVLPRPIWRQSQLGKACRGELHSRKKQSSLLLTLQNRPTPDIPPHGLRSWLRPFAMTDHLLGVLDVISFRPSAFTREDEDLMVRLCAQTAQAIWTAREREAQLQGFQRNLGQLSGALAGSQDRQTLMDNIVNTIAEVLRVDAATLYLADEQSKRLEIQAAYGYQEPLVAAGAFYAMGRGGHRAHCGDERAVRRQHSGYSARQRWQPAGQIRPSAGWQASHLVLWPATAGEGSRQAHRRAEGREPGRRVRSPTRTGCCWR